jgi:hypothetical protein
MFVRLSAEGMGRQWGTEKIVHRDMNEGVQ